MRFFLLSFIPLFVAMDTPGNIPVFLNLTEGMNTKRRNRVMWEASWTALIVAFLFMLLGKWIFAFLHITAGDFKIAGGLLLLFIAVTGVLPISKSDPKYDGVGVVPLGVPLMIGPAALTTLLIQVDTLPEWAIAGSLVVNIIIAFISFRYSSFIAEKIGVNSVKAASKVVALFLAAIAIMMIRVGLQEVMKIH